jgi:hypothetical protein
MDKSILFSLLFIILIGVAYYFWQEHQASIILLEPEITEYVDTVEKVEEEKKEVLYPVPVENLIVTSEESNIEVQVHAEEISLPALNESDDEIQQAFSRFYKIEKLLELFIYRDFVRHVVVSIDNMTTKRLPRRFVFTKSPLNSFMIKTTPVENEFILDESNFARYSLFMAFVNKVDNQKLIGLYFKYYPLFQEAYDELGYSGRYFNDRLVEVIDHLLQTPNITSPIKLIRPKVFYHFADPKLEDLSAGQKTLLRIGNENAAMIKAKLKSIRQILTSMKPEQ